MKRLWPYLRPYRIECVLAPALKMLEAVFELLVPLVVGRLIDQGIGGGDRGVALICGAQLMLLAVVGMAASITAQYFAARAATGFASSVREALWERILGLSYTEFDRVGTGTLITRQTADINQTQNGVNMFLRLFLRSPFIVLGAFVCAAAVDRRSAWIFGGVIVLLSLAVGAVMAVTIPLYRRVQGKLDRVLLKTRELISGARVIRAFRREAEEHAEFTSENDGLNRLQQSVGRISALTNPVTFVVVNLATVLLIYTGAIQVQVGGLTQGQVVALVNYMSQILVELVKLANLIVTITRAVASADRVGEALSLSSSMADGKGTLPATGEAAAVRFSHVDLAYATGSGKALTDIDFSAEPGEVIGIIGATASGKSSLISLIPRLYDAASGQVTVDGQDVKSLSLKELRQAIGLVPQKAVLFQGSIRENLRDGAPGATDAELWEALRQAQAEEFVREKEGGLDFVVEQGARNLSGGQRQRLTIARALARKPRILILDDASSALDYATDAALGQAIRSLTPRPTTFLVSQRTSSLRHCDRILVLEEGHLAGVGKHEELLENCQVYREIHASQSAER